MVVIWKLRCLAPEEHTEVDWIGVLLYEESHKKVSYKEDVYVSLHSVQH